jgi:hypothetical protein
MRIQIASKKVSWVVAHHSSSCYYSTEHSITFATKTGNRQIAVSVIPNWWDLMAFWVGHFFSLALPAHSGPRPLIQFRNHFYTDGRTPWTSDQLIARPLPEHRTTHTQKKRIHTSNIHALNRIRTHDPSVRASEDSSCHVPRGYCDRLG